MLKGGSLADDSFVVPARAIFGAGTGCFTVIIIIMDYASFCDCKICLAAKSGWRHQPQRHTLKKALEDPVHHSASTF